MKSPREILLERHQHASLRLDGIRRRAVASLEAGSDPAPSRPGWLRVLWTELFVPGRSAWAALATCWLAILVLNLDATRPPATLAASPTSTLSPAMLSLAREQRRLLDFETPAASDQEASPAQKFPSPRTEARPYHNRTS